MTPQQRYGLGASPSPVTPKVTGKPKKFADGGKVERQDSSGTEGLGRDTSKEADPSTNAAEAVEVARKKKVEHEVRRTINGAPIRNPSPVRMMPGSGGVRG